MKKPRISCSSSESPQVDRISALPDDTLIHILSFLTTKEAVHTCVLARRWTNLWASVPVLVLALDEFQTDGQVGDPKSYYEARKLFRRFETFVHGVLDNRKPTSLDSVIYLCPFEGWDYGAPTAWLIRVSLLNPREIHISIKNCTMLNLPNSIFSCASLECLEIYLNVRDKSTIFPVSIDLPALKYLKLRGVKLDNYFTEKLFMGCPSLEFLKLTDCNLYCSSISSEILKKMVIRRCYHHKKMQISCPGLATLYIASYLKSKRGITLNNMTSLVVAFVALRLWHQKASNHKLPILNLLGGLTNVTSLAFCVSFCLKEPLKRDILNCKHFDNLKKLTILGMSHDFDLVECLLKHSPKLEVLKLYLHVQNQGDFHGEPRLEVLGDVSFQHEYLKSVHIYGFNRHKLLATDVVKILSVYVKKIGKMVVR